MNNLKTKLLNTARSISTVSVEADVFHDNEISALHCGGLWKKSLIMLLIFVVIFSAANFNVSSASTSLEPEVTSRNGLT